MGVLEDIGIINNGKLSKSAFSGFVNDVKKRVITGAGIFKSPLIGTPVDPIGNFELAKIENRSLFPEFHKIWEERYFKTVKQLDVPGAFLAAAPPTFLIDPAALAKAMGVKSSKSAKFPDVLYEMQGLPAPGKPPLPTPVTIKNVMTNDSIRTLEFFNKYLGDLDSLNPKVIGNLMTIVAALPAPIVPQQPDPRVLKYGYIQRHKFETALYAAQRSTHTALMLRVTVDPSFLPSLLVQMSSGQNDLLLTEVYAAAKTFQSVPMSTSTFEHAAQEILMQHQVKMQCMALLGQTLGSGDVVKAIAATPETEGGLGLIDLSKTENEQTSSVDISTSSNDVSVGSNGSSSTSSISTISGSPSVPTNNSVDDQNYFISSDQPPADELPPGDSGLDDSNAQSQDYGFNAPPDDKYQPEGADFGDTNQGQQPFDSPPSDETQPTQQFGDGGESPFATPPPDEYPPNDGTQGQQTAPPGFGPAPNDEGSQAPTTYTYVTTLEPEGGETQKNFSKDNQPTDPIADDYPPLAPAPNIKSSDINDKTGGTWGSSDSTDDDDDDDDDDTTQGGSSSKSSGLNRPIRRRCKDLIEGGPTCSGGCLGPAPIWKNINFNVDTAFAGYMGGSSSVRWSQPIPGATATPGAIGAGYTNAEQIKAIFNGPKPIATTCTQLAGYICANVLYENTSRVKIPIDSDAEAAVEKSGFPYTAYSIGLGDSSSAIVGMAGLGGPCWVAAALGAWVSVDKNSGIDNKIPKYGDVYLTRDNSGGLRHIGIVMEWHPNEGWWAHCDAGQGGLISAADAASASQGMSYKKGHLQSFNDLWYIAGEPSQTDGDSKRILMGWIDIEVLVKKTRQLYGDQYKQVGIPPWAQSS